MTTTNGDKKTTADIVQLGKRRADRTGIASDWTPRDAVVEMLRLIDAGLSIDALIICYDGIDGASFQNATKSMSDAVGLLQVTQMELFLASKD